MARCKWDWDSIHVHINWSCSLAKRPGRRTNFEFRRYTSFSSAYESGHVPERPHGGIYR
jgi:hypothetical protein